MDSAMDSVMGLLAMLEKQSAQWSQQIFKLAHPELKTPSPVADMPMMRLDHALLAAVGYLLFVFIGSFIVKSIYGSAEQPSDRGSSVARKFIKEPILILASIYNAVQVVLCVFMVYKAIEQYQQRDFTLICNEFKADAHGMAWITWVFYMSKILDFMDTFFIIFRRKWRQLSFLHVYHHTSIFLIYWLNSHVGFDGDVYYTIVANGTIHAIMYFYYFMTTFNIPLAPILKPIVTHSQLIQFITMMSQAAYLLYKGDCAYPNRVVAFYLCYIFSLYLLFKNFQRVNYGSAKVSTKDKKKK